MPQPLIAVTMDRRDLGPPSPGPRVRPARPEVFLKQAVVDMLRAAGGVPLLLPPGALAATERTALLERVDGVVITGGAFDIAPRWYGQDTLARLDRLDEDRTALELDLARACLAGGLPLLGLCGGMQAMVVALGGTLVQDIASQVPGALDHEQPGDPATAWHSVAARGPLASALGASLQVNSTHHQAVADPGPFTVIGRAPDGVIEAVALTGHPFALGVQWHPELIGQRPLFRCLVRSARNCAT